MERLVFDPGLQVEFCNALPKDSSYGNMENTNPRFVYLPAAHGKALHPDNIVVTGIRGAGKTFWWTALQNPALRPLMDSAMQLGDNAKVSIGFGGTTSNPTEFPDGVILDDLVTRKDIDSRAIWTAVVFRQVLGDSAPKPFIRLVDWEKRAQWVMANREAVRTALANCDAELDRIKQYHLVLFDALDTTANTWETMNRITKGVLQVGVDTRPYKRIRVKIFLRPDQIAEPGVTSFNDASKIIGTRVELEWKAPDLYGMLWHVLANDPQFGTVFRKQAGKIAEFKSEKERQLFQVPLKLRTVPGEQEKLFHAITGSLMGRGKKKGKPYTWLPNHLGDANGAVSPRSFIVALKTAAESSDYRSEKDFVLHFEDIKTGVQKASGRRVSELNDDYPWITTLMTPLKGLNVPCAQEDIIVKWENANVLQDISKTPTRLPPAHLKDGAKAVLADLQELGIVAQRENNRINIPDVYRVGYGLGRHGGIRRMSEG